MARKRIAAGLFGLIGQDPAPQASALLSLGTMGVVRYLTQEADRRVAARGGAPWTPSIKRAQRQAAAAVRRRVPRGSVTRSAARAVAASSRPSEIERRAMRRESYRLQGESLSDEQLMAIPPSDLPPELVRRRSEAMESRPRDEKGRFLPQGAVAGDSAATPTPAASAESKPAASPGFDQQAAVERRQELEQKLRLVVGDFSKLPPQVRHNLLGQIERQVAEEFAPAEEPRREKERWETFTGRVNREKPKPATDEAAAAESTPDPTPPPPPPQTSAQRRQEDVQAVVDAQLEDTPQPRQQQSEQPSGWLDKVQMGLDAVGVADPTPIADGTNAVISLGRAAADPERRGEHLQNAAISAVSAAVPYAGDTAKLLKVGRAAKKAHAAQGAGRVATRGVAQGGAKDAILDRLFPLVRVEEGVGPVRVSRAQHRREAGEPAIGGGIGGTIRRMAGGVVGAMFGGNGQRGGVRPQYGGGQHSPGDSDQREGAPPRNPHGWTFTGSAGSVSPPAEPPRFGSPSPAPGDDGDSPRRRREEAEGIAAADTFTDRLKTGALAIAGLAGKVYLAVEGLQLFNRGVLALNRDLAQYSGPLAGAYAKADNADIRRDMERAGKLAGPLSDLQEETSELQDSLSELRTPVEGALIRVLAVVTKLTNLGVQAIQMLGPLQPILSLLEWIAGTTDKEAPGGRQFLQDLSDGKFDGFGIDDLGKRFELLDKATRSQMGLTAQPKKPQKGKAPTPP